MSVTLEPSGNGLIHIPQLHELEPRGKYPPCNCCPYGYHIDLDFVRYCEALSQGSEVSASKQRRRERRRQRHSMEVLLGLTSPSLWNIEQQLPQIPQEESVSPGAGGTIVRDALSQAVEMFEDTLQRSHKSANSSFETSSNKIEGQDTQPDGLQSVKGSAEDHNITNNEINSSLLNLSLQEIIEEQEVTPSIYNTMQDFDVASVGSAASGVSTGTLQTIREQMAVSLERMRELEEQVKLIPVLQVQLAVLKEEKRKLLLQQKLDGSELVKCTKGNNKQSELSQNDLGEVISSPNLYKCSYCQSSKYKKDQNKDHHTDQNHFSASYGKPDCIPGSETKPIKLAVRDRGVTCSVVTREVGISHLQPKMHHVGTSTHSIHTNLGIREVWKDNIIPEPIVVSQLPEQCHEKKVVSEMFNHIEKYKSPPTLKLNKSTLTSPETRKQCSVRTLSINTDLQMNNVYTEDDLDESVAKAVKLHEKYFVARSPETNESETQTINNFVKPLLQIVENLDTGIQVDQSFSRKHEAIQCEPFIKHGVGTQSDGSHWTRDACVQMNSVTDKQDTTVQWDLTLQSTVATQYEPHLWQQDISVQAEEILKWRVDAGIMAKPRCVEVAVEAKPTTRDRGCSDGTINDVVCDRCKVKKRSIGVGSGNYLSLEDLILVSAPTESGGVNHINLDKKEIVTVNSGCQVEMTKRATKITDTLDLSRNRTHEVAVNTCKSFAVTKMTDTFDLARNKTREAAINTIARPFVDIGVDCCIDNQSHINGVVNVCSNCSSSKVHSEKDSVRSCEGVPITSPKIGRLGSSIPIPVSAASSFHSSNSSITATSSQSSTSLSSGTVLAKTNISSTKLSNTNISNTSESSYSEQERKSSSGNTSITANVSHRLKRQDTYTKLCDDLTEDSNLLASTVDGGSDSNTKRAEPSKEMKAALKVLNDYLVKSPNQKELPRHLTNAANIVQQEWFKVSGGKTVNPMAVEDYLDYIEGYSSSLLEYVVNMTDMSGNTALHYAISSGNFDVVSILLDSKVCNVNKRNAAGYTCVMLATLVTLRSETHRQIIRRMFHMADVNMKAKPHGQTALMLATSHGSLEMVEMLTEAGADMNIQDADGSTALMCAADHGFVDIVKHIISQPDCDVSITDSDGCSALNIAMESGNRHIGLLLYAHEHFSRGSSPHGSIRHRNSRSSTPTPKCNITHSGHTSASPVSVCEQSDKTL